MGGMMRGRAKGEEADILVWVSTISTSCGLGQGSKPGTEPHATSRAQRQQHHAPANKRKRRRRGSTPPRLRRNGSLEKRQKPPTTTTQVFSWQGLGTCLEYEGRTKFLSLLMPKMLDTRCRKSKLTGWRSIADRFWRRTCCLSCCCRCQEERAFAGGFLSPVACACSDKETTDCMPSLIFSKAPPSRGLVLVSLFYAAAELKTPCQQNRTLTFLTQLQLPRLPDPHTAKQHNQAMPSVYELKKTLCLKVGEELGNGFKIKDIEVRFFGGGGGGEEGEGIPSVLVCLSSRAEKRRAFAKCMNMP